MAVTKALVPGGQLGRYELLTPIAQGGMATVWAARQTGSRGFRKTVAIKTTLPVLSDDPQFERMFVAEARLAMRVHHPNVVETLDLGEEEGLLYLVMEWIDGESLSTLLKKVEAGGEPFPARLALHICARAARGLHAAHEVTDDDDQPVGIVHRDVSPQNLMITYDGHVKVVDFGVAKGHSELGPTQVGQFKGKVPYMAPEQATGEGIDRRTDVFAMGILLYRLTVGKHPFLGPNQEATMTNVIGAVPVPPSDRVPGYAPELERVVQRCLQKAPRARYASMAALADELDALLVTMGPPVTDAELGATIKRHLGELRTRRREAMREAARALGWAMATGELSRASLSGPQSLTPSTNSRGSLDASVASQTKRSRENNNSRVRVLAAAVVLGTLGAVGLLALALSRNAEPAPRLPATPAAASEALPKMVPASPSATVPSDAGVRVDLDAATAPAADPRGAPRAPTGGARLPPIPSTKKTESPKRESWQTGPDMGF